MGTVQIDANILETSDGGFALSINDYVNGSYTQTTSTVAAEPTLVINRPAGDYITVRNLETLEFDDATKSLEEVLEPFSQNTPAIDLITANQSANENTTSSFAENKLTGLSIDTGGHQNIVKIELEIYFSDVSSGNVLPFECKFSNAAPEGMSLTKIGAGKYKALITLGDREPESVITEFFDQFAYSPSEDLAGDFKGHITIRNKNATNDWSYSKASEFDLSVTPIAEVPVAEIEALSDLNHDGKADNHQKFYVNKDVLLEFTVEVC